MSQSDRDIELGYIKVYKMLDDDGKTFLYIEASDDLAIWESYGMLSAACDIQRLGLQAAFVEDDEEGEDVD